MCICILLFIFKNFPGAHIIFSSARKKTLKNQVLAQGFPVRREIPGHPHFSFLEVTGGCWMLGGSGDTIAASSAEVPGRMAHCESLFVPAGWDFRRQGTV